MDIVSTQVEAEDLLDPRDPHKVSITVLNRFVQRYMSMALTMDSEACVIGSSVMTTREGRVSCTTTWMSKERTMNTFGLNCRVLARILEMYNLSALLSEGESDGCVSRSLFISPTVIRTLGVVTNRDDKMSIQQLRRGISLTTRRSMMLRTSGIKRNSHRGIVKSRRGRT